MDISSILRIFALEMEKIRFDIVGLYHWDVRDHWKEYVAEAVGKRLTMQPEPENVKDPYAVRTREGGLHVGYVAVPDLDVWYQALKGSGKQRLRGVVVEISDDPPVLTVEVEVDAIDWNYEPYDDSIYAGWHYEGLSLLPKNVGLLGDLTADLIDDLESMLPNREGAHEKGVANRDGSLEERRTNRSPSEADEFPKRGPILQLVNQLLETNLYDPSREMTRSRYRIERLLAQQSDPELQAAARKLRLQKGMLMNHDDRDKVARYLFLDWPTRLRQKGLENYHYTYDNRLDELKSQLVAFPYQLYDKFLNDPVDFLREVYYKHVPRKYLVQLLSGIILMILKGRVDIKKWGRAGDTEPIETIHNLCKPMNTPDGEKKIQEALRKLLQMKDKDGHLIIKQKNQWAGIMSVLVFEYHVIDAPDMRAFCRKMDEWGFGPESGYENYCDYDSLSKASKYATSPFTDWKGTGTAHQRQVHAATELRGILKGKVNTRI